ncbi:MAG: MEDS domain-containing protein [Candidatus Thorarchaeota archaeon]|nr:MEDS domain-containing protein [Candidatus Thorarchaeota archaeon]
MSKQEDTAKALSDFGLTLYQARVYLAAVRLGTTIPSRISATAKVRREEVYRALPVLEKIGLVERVLGRPVGYRAVPIEDALSMLIARKKSAAEKELTQLAQLKTEFLERHREELQPTEAIEEDNHFVLVTDKDAVRRRTSTSIGEAQREVAIIDTGENVIRFLTAFSDSLHSACTRGVRVRVLTEFSAKLPSIPDKLCKCSGLSFELRYVNDLPGRYLIIDGQQVLISTSTGRSMVSESALWTNNPSLVELVARSFDSKFRDSTDWRSHKPQDELSKFLREIRPHDHAILVYDSIQAKQKVLFTYLQHGLASGEAAKYVCSEETSEDIRKAMNRFGMMVDEKEQSGALDVLDYTDLYIKDGVFRIEDVMQAWDRYYRTAIAQGFKGMRVTGEMSCFIQHDMLRELIDYERALHSVLELPMSAICAYRADLLKGVEDPPGIYAELVNAHGRVLFAQRNHDVGEVELRIAY